MERMSVQHDRDAEKFFLRSGDQESYLLYQVDGETLDLYSTYVPDAFRGQGIAGRLVEEALDHARSNGYKVRPTCPYVASYIEQHPEQQDLKV